MAPEQLFGEATTETDIYAVGLIVFEMLTGRKPFEGHPLSQALSRTSQEPIHVSTIIASIPDVWDEVIVRCLARVPSARFRGPEDVSLDLNTGPQTPLPGLFHPNPFYFWIFSALAALLVGAFVARKLESDKPLRPTIAHIALIPASTAGGLTMDPSISRDGRLAYVSDRGTGRNLELYVQEVGDESTARRLTFGADNKAEPSFSADGATIVYSVLPKGLYSISSSGGTPRLLASEGAHGRISPDGTKVVYCTGDNSEHPIGGSQMYIVPSAGGSSVQIVSEFYGARRPTWLPDGRHLLFEGWQDRNSVAETDAELYVLDLDSGSVTATGALRVLRSKGLRLFNQLGNFTGNSLFLSARLESAANIYRISLDPITHKVMGLVEQLTASTSLVDSPTVSADGTLVIASLEGEMNIWELGLTTPHTVTERKVTDSLSYDTYPTISQDGNALSFTRTLGQERQIWIRSMATGVERLVLGTKDEKLSPVIRPDGQEIVFRSQSEAGNSVNIVSVKDGKTEKLCNDCGTPTGWAPNGDRILLAPDAAAGISVVDRRTHELQSLYREQGVELGDAQVSPNGKWIVFCVSYGHSRRSLVIAPFDTSIRTFSSRWYRITDSRFRDQKPRWSDDGSVIYFESDRDGFDCIWAQRIDLVHGRPAGGPVAVQHYHTAAVSLGEASEAVFNLAVHGNKLFLNVPRVHGNVWRGSIAK
jgi:Tol biopolymer transport system component